MYFNFDKRILYVMFAVLIALNLRGYITNQDSLLALVLTLPAVLIAITFHEFAHAYSAYKLGDDTPKIQGRLTLNPLAHLDPIGSVLLVFAGIGWGKPVQIEPRNFTRKFSMSTGEAIVSAAGPLMNFFLAILFTFVYFLIGKFAPLFFFSKLGYVILLLLQTTIMINIGLGVFNLIPLPPLDGSKVLRNFLPFKAKEWFDRYEQIFYIAFVVLWVTGLAALITSPVINFIYNGLINLIGLIF